MVLYHPGIALCRLLDVGPPLPRVALRTILRDELVSPFFRAGIIAVFSGPHH